MFVDSAPRSHLLAALSKPLDPAASCPSAFNPPTIDPDLVSVLNQKQAEPPTPINSRTIEWKFDWCGQRLTSSDGRSVCLHSKCASCFETEAVRTDKPIRANCVTSFEWTVCENTTGGTSVMFGLCRETSRLHSPGYMDLLGENESSWGLSSRGRLHHNGRIWDYCPAFDDGRQHRIRCVVNSFNGEVVFYVDGRAMGVAFRGVEIGHGDGSLYACVSSTVARTVIRLGAVHESYLSLHQMCAYRVRDHPECVRKALEEYRLPKSMIYATYS